MSYYGASYHTCAKCLKVSAWPADEFPDQCWKEDETGQVCGSFEFLRREVYEDTDGSGVRRQWLGEWR